jgi:hypothetical protein
MNSLRDISFDNEAKVRKSIISISIALLVISNIKFSNNNLDLFGLELVVSPEKIGAVLRLSLSLLLIAQLFFILERIPQFIARSLAIKDDRWWGLKQPEIAEFQGGAELSEYEQRMGYEQNEQNDPANLEWDDRQIFEKIEREKRRKRVMASYRPIATTTRTITRYIFPMT